MILIHPLSPALSQDYNPIIYRYTKCHILLLMLELWCKTLQFLASLLSTYITVSDSYNRSWLQNVVEKDNGKTSYPLWTRIICSNLLLLKHSECKVRWNRTLNYHESGCKMNIPCSMWNILRALGFGNMLNQLMILEIKHHTNLQRFWILYFLHHPP